MTHTSRSLGAGASALLVALLGATSVLAAGPTPRTGGEPPGDSKVLPLTPEQYASKQLKDGFIAGLLAGAAGTDGADYVCQFDPCEPFSQALDSYPRQQIKSYYCGPATVQIASSQSWGLTGGAYKYTQREISDNWTHTDANGQTFLSDAIDGMNGASRLPANFVYLQLHNPSYDEWHAAIIMDVVQYEMSLAAGVIPWKTGAAYHLLSWNIQSNGGHYIELHGYSGRIGDANRYVDYSDPAGTYADSIAANWHQLSYPVYQTMMYNNGNLVY